MLLSTLVSTAPEGDPPILSLASNMLGGFVVSVYCSLAGVNLTVAYEKFESW